MGEKMNYSRIILAGHDLWDTLKPLIFNWTKDHTMDEIYRGSPGQGLGDRHSSIPPKICWRTGKWPNAAFLPEAEHPETG